MYKTIRIMPIYYTLHLVFLSMILFYLIHITPVFHILYSQTYRKMHKARTYRNKYTTLKFWVTEKLKITSSLHSQFNLEHNFFSPSVSKCPRVRYIFTSSLLQGIVHSSYFPQDSKCLHNNIDAFSGRNTYILE